MAGPGRKLLVVDDDPPVVEFLRESLAAHGFDVATDTVPDAALDRIAGDTFDLVITDLNMPNLDGYGLIGTLRKNEKYRETPIIILSSEDGDEDRKRGITVGANSYLVKPFKSSLLLSEVSKFLTLAHAEK